MATQQTEALSFVARLPAPSPALTDRLEKWGAKECDRSRSVFSSAFEQQRIPKVIIRECKFCAIF